MTLRENVFILRITGAATGTDPGTWFMLPVFLSLSEVPFPPPIWYNAFGNYLSLCITGLVKLVQQPVQFFRRKADGISCGRNGGKLLQVETSVLAWLALTESEECKLQAPVYDILEEGAGKRCSECVESQCSQRTSLPSRRKTRN